MASSFGDRLRREREMRGVSLDEISESTKISTRNLKALEDDDFERLPGGIFNKGFVRSYAKFLGLNEEQAVADFNAAYSDFERSRTSAFAAVTASDEEEEEEAKPSGNFLIPALVILVLVAAAFGVWKLTIGRADVVPDAQAANHAAAQAKLAAAPAPSSSQAVAASAPATSSATESTPAATAPAEAPKALTETGKTEKAASAPPSSSPAKASTSASASAEKSPAPIELEVRARENCWIQVTSDGRLTETTLPAGKSKLITAKERVEILLGNAGGVEIAYNGKVLGDLGPANSSRRLTFTPQGYE